MNLDTLNTIIAIVIILLVLSLIVQAIQTAIKKLFKVKSGTILNSLEDLFSYITLPGDKTPKGLVEEVKEELKKLGRVSVGGKLMIDSIARDDLKKILEKIGQQDLQAQVETWFDPVMQSFDERYTRHMKTISLCISIVVVIYLNANFFKIYRSISASDVQRSLIVSKGEDILASAKKENENKPSESPSPSASPSPSRLDPASASASAVVSPSSSPSVSPAASPSPSPSPNEIKKSVEQVNQVVRNYVNTYEEFGFSPLTWRQTTTWLTGFFLDQTQVRDDKGRILTAANEVAKDCVEVDKQGNPILDKNGKPANCDPAWRPMTREEWFAGRRADFSSLTGWALMALLLSVGAPFWQDTLESLFGIKHLIRQKSETKNVEEKKGGQP
ncbi:MAG TPA: hypothetical protein VFQ43_08660, partial [Nitrososphaera sp.]|nr:hypothetical protein [Nitrososphaera sp.]